ncbi:MAG: ABC transporter permease [Pseudomonadales bacterium]|nr:ABC transporter permease [Pseudomonadales bacterium]MBP9032599.1 ABC transporter permease [Pseudomonadales bacterium]
MSPAPDPDPARCAIEASAGHATLVLSGDWTVTRGAPRSAAVLEQLRAQAAREIGFDCSALGSWDSLLVTLLLGIDEECTRAGIRLDTANLPEGALRLMALARTVRAEHRAPSARAPWWRRLLAGEPLLQARGQLLETLAFVGELLIALGKLCVGRANTRARDFLWFVQQAGPAAIGIVTLISVLVGMILAYLGSVQLRQFGAQIYVADLVGIGMVREMAALMTGVIMAGRTGAAYAAQLGTMQTREEIDAIRTLGMSPMEFLVLPRLLALVLVMPLLTLYSGVLGMCGGALVAIGMDVSWTQYVHETRLAVTLTHILTGVAKSVVFGLLIAIAGCRAGMQCGRSSEAVGKATTRAVVTAIVWLIVADAAFNIVYQRLGI